MSDDLKRITGGPVAPVDQAAIEGPRGDAPAAKETATDTYVQVEQSPFAIEAARLRRLMECPDENVSRAVVMSYVQLSEKFAAGSPEVDDEAVSLRKMMEDPGERARSLAAGAYGGLSAKFAEGSPEVYEGAAVLLRLMDDPEIGVRRFAGSAYGALSAKFVLDSPEVYREAKALRRLMSGSYVPDDAVLNALNSYTRLVPKFADGSPEVYKGARHVMEILVGPGRRIRSMSVFASAAQIFGLLVRKFRADGPIAASAGRALLWYTSEPFIKEYFGEVLKQNFHHLSSIGFFKAGFESGDWIENLGLLGFSEEAVRNLRGFANQPGFIGFRDSVMTVLDTLRDWTPDKMMVLNRVFEATDPTKWKSVRNTLRTLRALAALDSLPARLRNGFYRFRRDVAGDPRALLRAGSEKTLIDFLYAVIGGKGALELLFMDEVQKSGESLKLWRHAQAVRNFLCSKGLLSLFAQSASFMNGDGRRILKNLLGDLATSPIVDGELRYQKRYDRMVEQLGFSPEFVARWSREWKTVRELRGGVVDVGEARALVMKQAAEQLAVHVNSTPGKDGEFKELPDRLRALTEKLGRGEADVEEIGRLHETLELKYQAVREAYGDLFANSRIDLKNLRTGLMKGVRVAKRSEATEISGGVDRLAFHGMIPTETCQRLSSLYAESTNGKGQPLNKLLWGQFKLANYVMDDEVMARRMLEVTRDGEGVEHLLVERAYTAGGFARLAEFDEDIVEHAHGLGISRDRVHFLDRHEKREVPGPLATGALMYRDSGLPEVNPALMRPFHPLPLPVMAMPMMSAGMMLRTGT